MTISDPAVAIVDDDSIYQFTAKRIIQLSSPSSTIRQFNSGSDALDYLARNRQIHENLPDVLLLDINMPVTDGWMFLDAYQKMRSSICKDIMIYVVTSSIDSRDISHAKQYPEVRGYISKPLGADKVKEILDVETRIAS